MPGLIKQNPDGGWSLVAPGEETEVDINLVRNIDGGVSLRPAELTVDLPRKGRVVFPETVFDAVAGENVDGTFINTTPSAVLAPNKWGEDGVEFTGTATGGGGGWIPPEKPLAILTQNEDLTHNVEVSGSTAGSVNKVYYSYGDDSWALAGTITGDGTVENIPDGGTGLFFAYIDSQILE